MSRPPLARAQWPRVATRLLVAAALLLLPSCRAATARGTEAAASAPGRVTEEAITFTSGGVTLAGTLLRPASPAPAPAIVMLHGSGPGPRTPLSASWARRFVADGFAALVFDKRGSGQSGGSWIDSSLDDLASDALAAAAFVKAQPGIDARRVGLWGVSQAGWVIPRAIAREPTAVAFAVIVTGGALKPIDVERHDYGAALERIGASPDARTEALGLVDRYLEYLRTGADRAGLEKAAEEAHRKPWSAAVDVGRVIPNAATRASWQWVADYDPSEDIRRLSVPVLVVLGGRDRPALAESAARRWREAFVASANHDATVVELLGADHGGVVEGSHHIDGRPQRYVPGYLELVDGWLVAHARAE